MMQKAATFNLPIIELSSDDYVIPGFIDIHIHGSKGADVMDGDVDALAVISKSLYTQGVTSYLATTMTAANEQILKAMHAIKIIILKLTWIVQNCWCSS